MPIFKFNHVQNIIKLTSKQEDMYSCILYKDSEFSFKNIRRHLLSNSHKDEAKNDPAIISLLEKKWKICNQRNIYERASNHLSYPSELDYKLAEWVSLCHTIGDDDFYNLG